MCFAPQRRAIFPSLIWPAGSAPAALVSLLFDPPDNHWKNTVFRDFPTFSRICIFFLLTLSLLWSSLFYSSLLSDSSHLCFPSVQIAGSLTSKLPSTIIYAYSTSRFLSISTKSVVGHEPTGHRPGKNLTKILATWPICKPEVRTWENGHVAGSEEEAKCANSRSKHVLEDLEISWNIMQL